MKILNGLKLPGAMLGLTVLLTACPGNGEGGVTPPPVLDLNRVQGTVPNWKAGEAEVDLYMYYADKLAMGNSATIAADGSLNTLLPTPTVFGSFLDGCSLSAGAIGNDFQVEYVDAVAFNTAGNFLGLITETTPDGATISRIYSTSAATLKGKATCGTASRLDLDFSVNAGWNVLGVTRSETNGIPTYAYRNVATTTQLQLGFKAAKPTVTLSPNDYSQLSLRQGTSVTRDITLTSTGTTELTGTVDFTTSLPGVKVTPSKVTVSSAGAANSASTASLLSAQAAPSRRPNSVHAQMVKAQSLTTTLTFSLSDQAVDYSGPFDLIASQGGTALGKVTLYTDIRVPSVSASISSSSISAYQGGTASVGVSVRSQEGFSGAITLNLTNLPIGVTSSPVTIMVSPNATTSVNVPLQVAADAPLSTTTVTLTGDKVSNLSGPATFSLAVKPARTSLGTVSSSLLAPATNGIWISSGSGYYGSGYQTTLRRMVGGKNEKEVTLSNVTNTLLPIPGGDIYVLGNEYYSNSNTVYRVKDDGTVSNFATPSTSGMSTGIVDAQGRVWFSTGFTNSAGSYTYGLFQWDPATGTQTLIDSGQAYAYSSTLVASNNGQYALYRSSNNSNVLLINTSTSTVSTVANPSGGSIGALAISNTGQVWYSSYGGLTRVNSDGTATTFSADGGSISTMIGFDQNNTNTLWASGYSSILKVDTTSGTISQIPTDSIVGSVVNRTGGVSFLTSGGYTGNGYEYFLSVLP